MALVLAIGGVADFFREREIRVLQRAHHRRVHADVERFQAIGIARRIEHPVERFRVGAFRRGQAQHGAIGVGHRREARAANNPSAARCVPRAARRIRARTLRRRAARCLPLRHVFHRRVVEAIEKLRIDFANARDHLADHGRASVGVSVAACIRHSRCSTMPESVCTMVVDAATGRT